jgi:hypothetical protein
MQAYSELNIVSTENLEKSVAEDMLTEDKPIESVLENEEKGQKPD